MSGGLVSCNNRLRHGFAELARLVYAVDCHGAGPYHFFLKSHQKLREGRKKRNSQIHQIEGYWAALKDM